MFTRKHYKKIAEILKKVRYAPERNKMDILLAEFDAMFRTDNPRFDSYLFREATFDDELERRMRHE